VPSGHLVPDPGLQSRFLAPLHKPPCLSGEVSAQDGPMLAFVVVEHCGACYRGYFTPFMFAGFDALPLLLQCGPIVGRMSKKP
jgi:hypothetical protein